MGFLGARGRRGRGGSSWEGDFQGSSSPRRLGQLTLLFDFGRDERNGGSTNGAKGAARPVDLDCRLGATRLGRTAADRAGQVGQLTYEMTMYTFVGRGRPVDGRIAAVVEILVGGVTRLVDSGIRLEEGAVVLGLIG